jgi:hypothetical protein
MAHSQQIVDDIRSFILSADWTLTDPAKQESVRQLAAAYATACQEAGTRLRRCADFLQNGLRAEAIHLAEVEPNLLDELSILDFPEREQWEQICVSYAFPPPGQINFSLAEALNEAYAESLPLEGLLRKHRLLALARAPLTQRLTLMRTIAAKDTTNPLWKEDIQAFEKARQRQLEQEAQQAVAQDDADRVFMLNEELRQTRWLTPVPPSLTKYVSGAANRFLQRELRERLELLAAQLTEAMNTLDVGLGRQLRPQWDAVIMEIDLPGDDPLRQRPAAALDWLRQEDRQEAQHRKFLAALEDLRVVLTGPGSREEITAAYQAALQFEEAVPADVEMAYQSRLAGLARAKRRLQLIIAGSVAAVLLLTGGLTAYFVHENGKAARAREAAEQLEQLLETRQMQKAQATLESLEEKEPAIAKLPELARIRERFQEEVARERRRKEAFRQAVAEARAALDENALNASLHKARSQTPLSEEEQQILARLEKDKKSSQAKSQKERDSAFQAQLDDLKPWLRGLEAAVEKAADSPESLQRAGEIQEQLDRLRKLAEAASPTLREQARELTGRLESARTAIAVQSEENRLVDAFTRGLHTPDNLAPYARALGAYIQRFPNKSRTEDFRQVLREVSLWEQLTSWHQLVAADAARLYGLTPKDARTLADRCNRFVQGRRLVVDADRITSFVKTVEAIAQQDATAPNTAAAKLHSRFNAGYVKDVWFVRLEGDKVYYLNGDPQVEIEAAIKKGKNGYTNIKYLVNFSGTEKSLPLYPSKLRGYARAPQALVAAEAERLLSRATPERWDDALLELGERVCKEKDMDPVLRYCLFKAVLDAASKSSYSLEPLLAPCYRDLKSADVDEAADWINPESECKDPRDRAGRLFDRMAPLDSLKKEAAKRRQELALAAAESDVRLLGWLWRDRGGNWICRQAVDYHEPSELCVLVPLGADSARFVVVGAIQDGKITLDAAGREALVEGRLVFARKPRKS